MFGEVDGVGGVEYCNRLSGGVRETPWTSFHTIVLIIQPGMAGFPGPGSISRSNQLQLGVLWSTHPAHLTLPPHQRQTGICNTFVVETMKTIQQENAESKLECYADFLSLLTIKNLWSGFISGICICLFQQIISVTPCIKLVIGI